jgi:hypothetical protein
MDAFLQYFAGGFTCGFHDQVTPPRLIVRHVTATATANPRRHPWSRFAMRKSRFLVQFSVELLQPIWLSGRWTLSTFIATKTV